MPDVLVGLMERNKVLGEPVIGGNQRAINRAVFKKGTKQGDVGIELEIEGDDLPRAPQVANLGVNGIRWNVIPDGSLRGGVEYVLSEPVNREDIRLMVRGLFDTIKNSGARINNSNRCSTHVHVNVSDYKVNELTSAIALWTTLSTPLIRWCGRERVRNHFCLSSSDEEGTLEAWELFLRTGIIPRRDGIKYSALNILPIWNLGSLEFRCGGPPENEDKIVYWAKICNGLVKYARERLPNPMQLSYALSELGPEALLREVIENAHLGPRTTASIVEEIIGEYPINREVFDSFRDVQHLLAEFPWDESMEAINRAFVPRPFGDV